MMRAANVARIVRRHQRPPLGGRLHSGFLLSAAALMPRRALPCSTFVQCRIPARMESLCDN